MKYFSSFCVIIIILIFSVNIITFSNLFTNDSFKNSISDDLSVSPDLVNEVQNFEKFSSGIIPKNQIFQKYQSLNDVIENNNDFFSVSTPESSSVPVTAFPHGNSFKASLKFLSSGYTWDGNIAPVLNPGDWTPINFSASFTAPPTVLVTISDTSDNIIDLKASYHIRSVTTTGFEVFAKLSGNISWVAYGLGSGGYSNYEHGTINVVSTQWTNVSFLSTWSSLGGVVISQETNIEDLRAASIRKVTNNNFEVLSKYSLKIHWIAVGDGIGGSNDSIVRGTKENFPKQIWNTIDFGGTFSSLPTVVNSQVNVGAGGDIRDNPIDLLTESNFTSYARTATTDMNWIAIGDDNEAPILHNYGIENSGDGSARFWVNASDSLSLVDSVIIRLNSTNISMTQKSTGLWIYEPSINYNDYYTYQIVNITDNAGNILLNPSDIENVTFNYDTVIPNVIDFAYKSNVLANGTFAATVSDSWGKIDNVMVILSSCNCIGSTTALMQFNGTHYVNDSIQMTRGAFSYFIFAKDTYGNSYNSSLRPDFLSNNAPVISNATLLPDPIRSNQQLTLSYDFVDLDGDSEGGSEIRWYKNDSLVGLYNNSLFIPSAGLHKGDTWYASVRPKDGQTFGYTLNTSLITIGNALPEVTEIVVSPTIAYTTSNLQVNYNYGDGDGDSENTTARQIFWYKNGILEPNHNNSMTILSSFTNKGENWSFSLQVNDGEEFSIIYYSGNNTILNSKPSVINPEFNSSSISSTDDFNISYGYFDSDNDNENSSLRKIYWYINGLYDSSYDNNPLIYSSNTSDGQFWYYVLQVFDGLEYSNNFTSIGINIGTPLNVNAPVVSNLTLIGGTSPTSVDDLIINYSYSDFENNPEAGSEIRWYKNSTGIFILQSEFNDTKVLPASATQKGDQWYFSVQPKDGLLFGNVTNSSIFTIGNTRPQITTIDLLPGLP